uniref:Uncharacterized protein n=1 Tax=Rhizophora mucronata TaxID=61149 RepID=A0A2P2R3W2_RHIMU
MNIVWSQKFHLYLRKKSLEKRPSKQVAC